ncbi:MAG: ABC transporter permease [Deltaproteobacteria bacterium]|nr:ABC transporter permease [Deltaproteobacteria bacterium]
MIWFQMFRLVKKELIQLLRDKKLWPPLMLAPVLQMLLLGYAATLDVEHVPMAVWDRDRSAISRSVVEQWVATNLFDVQGYIDSREELERLILRGEIKVGLMIPPNFGQEVVSGGFAPLQLVVDGSESNSALIATNYASILTNDFAVEHLPASSSATPAAVVEIRPRVWYNPALKSRNYMVPGVIVNVLMVSTIMLTALTIVKEKELGTMEQLIVTPLRRTAFILGKLIPFIGLGFLNMTAVLIVGIEGFGVPVRGEIGLLYALTGVFLLTTLSIGLFISTLVQNQQQAMNTAFFVVFPMIILSGFLFPTANMPKFFQWVSLLNPVRYFVEIIRGIILKGNGWEILWPQALVLALFGVVLIVFSTTRIHRQIR